MLYLLWSGLGRFWIEGLRTDSLLVPGLPLRVSQVLAAVMVAVAVVCLILFRNRTKLLGCGSPRIMALNEIVDAVPEEMILEPAAEAETAQPVDAPAQKAEQPGDRPEKDKYL